MIVDRPNVDDGHLHSQQGDPVMSKSVCYVELPAGTLDDQGSLLDSVIHFTFDTLHVRHLHLRIVPESWPN